jgi:hypothetical protein
MGLILNDRIEPIEGVACLRFAHRPHRRHARHDASPAERHNEGAIVRGMHIDGLDATNL